MEEIYKILEEIKPECDFENSIDFIRDGLLDSFDLIALISDVESLYGILVDGRDIIPENFSSIDMLKKLIEKYGVHI